MPVRRTITKPGFALVLVMILVAVGFILGMSYLLVASVHVQISRNYQSLARARYLAESGLDHALYILRFTPEALEGSDTSPLDPFYVDGTSDSYTISAWEDAEAPGRYTLTSTATVGDVRRTSSVTAYRTAGATVNLDRAILVGSGSVWMPWDLTVQGDIHVNGSLLNFAAINGNASTTQDLTDPWGRITGSADSGAEEISLPDIDVDDYINYRLNGTDYQAVEFTEDELNKNDPLAKGGAVTPGNIGGIVYLNPSSGDTVTLKKNLNFTGTLVINGHLVLDGKNITLTAVDGFPAIVATGSVKITNSARKVTINGTVAANQGIMSSGDTLASSTTINGALISDQRGYGSGLRGSHTLNHQQDRTELYDFSQGPNGSTPQVTILAWND